jgi:hypothetical protein
VGAALVILFGLDAGSPGLADADHLARDLATRLGLGETAVACTHLIRDERPHVALSFEIPDELAELVHSGRFGDVGVALGQFRSGPPNLAAGAAEAVAAHANRSGGRAVLYPGGAALTGTLTAGAILAGSAVDRITVLAGADPPAADDLVHTRDHVRPEWRDGILTLVTTPVAPGEYAPFEVPNPTPCCADHAGEPTKTNFGISGAGRG